MQPVAADDSGRTRQPDDQARFDPTVPDATAKSGVNLLCPLFPLPDASQVLLAFLVWNADFGRPKIGEMDTELFEEFFRAFAMNALLTLHVTRRAGHNAHHVAEACFKSTARALRMAAEPDPRAGDAIPSTKGSL